MRVAVFLACSVVPALAYADVQHVVGKGHTIDAIATRYHVTAKSIIEANHLKNPKSLHPGDVLVIPGKDAPKAKVDKNGVKADKDKSGVKAEKADKTEKSPAAKPATPDSKALEKALEKKKLEGHAEQKKAESTNYAMKAKTPGVVHVKRLATTEEADVRVSDRKNKVSSAALKSFEKLMRSPNGMAHPIEPRLISLLGIVSNHFGSRKIEVVSGFRPFTPTQHNPHSNHMHGKAVDFRVVGVPNETVRDFCRTLKNVGCGYYPNSVFVHMDVRDQSAFWIDYSKPGEAPRYNAPNVDADEGTTEVHDENHPATGATPDETKADAKPAVTEPAKPAVTEPAKPAVTEPAKPAVTEPAKPADAKPTAAN